MTFRDTIPRTECSCEACQVGCRSMPGFLALGDLEKIIDYFKPGDAGEFICSNFVASEGAKVGKWNDRGTMDMFEIKTITPAQWSNGECVFYSAGKCGIHPVSPFGCACIDTHQDRAQADSLIHPALAELCADQERGGRYSRIHAALVAAGRVARPRSERRVAFEALYAKATARMAHGGQQTPLDA